MDSPARPLATHVLESDSDAFGVWVRQHLYLVYSAARRQVAGNTHRAEEVTQLVFLTAHRKASALARHPAPLAWLHQATRHAASELRRAEIRRLARETTAATDPALAPCLAEPPADWTRVEPLLDDALATLRAPDRETILLRYFAGQAYAETGRQLGLAENTVRMRTDRALEKLRLALAKRGVTSTASALGLTLTGHAVSAAPATVSASTFAALAAGTADVAASTLLLTMTFLQKSLLATLVLSSLGVAVYQTRQVRRLESELAAKHQAWLTEKDADATRLAVIRAELTAAQETLASQARDDAAAQTEAAAIAQEPEIDATVAWLERLELLKTLLHARPQATIPELQLLEQEDWLSAAMKPLANEGDVRRAFAHLRALAREKFGAKAKGAIQKYVNAQGDRVPANTHELLPYFDSPLATEILKTWKLVENQEAQPGAVPSRWGIKSGPGPDNEMDGQLSVYSNQGTMSSGHNNVPNTLYPVLKRFAEATPNGLSRKPETLSAAELSPHALSPEERAAIEAHFGPIQLPPPQP